MSGYAYGNSFKHGCCNETCGTRRYEYQNVNSDGGFYEFKLGGSANYSGNIFKNTDGTNTTRATLGSAAQFGFATGKVMDGYRGDRVSTFKFETNLYGGSYYGGNASIYHKSTWARSNGGAHDLSGQLRLSTDHKEYLSDLKDIQPGDFKNPNTKFSTTEAKFTLGMEYNYKDLLAIEGNAGGKYMHNTANINGVKTTYDGGAITFGGEIRGTIQLPENCPTSLYVFGRGGCDIPVDVSIGGDLKVSTGKPLGQGELGLGIKF